MFSRSGSLLLLFMLTRALLMIPSIRPPLVDPSQRPPTARDRCRSERKRGAGGGRGLEGPRLGGEQAPPCYDQVVLNTAHTGNTAAASINADATRMTQDTVSRMMRAQVALVITVRVRAGAWAGMLHLTEPLRQSSSGSAWDLLARGAADNGHGGSHATVNAAANAAGERVLQQAIPCSRTSRIYLDLCGSPLPGLLGTVWQRRWSSKRAGRSCLNVMQFMLPSISHPRHQHTVRWKGCTTGRDTLGSLLVLSRLARCLHQ